MVQLFPKRVHNKKRIYSYKTTLPLRNIAEGRNKYRFVEDCYFNVYNLLRERKLNRNN
jgi:hypothetical protein